MLEVALGPLARFEVLAPEQPEAGPEPEPAEASQPEPEAEPNSFPGDKPWPKFDPAPISLEEWRATALTALKATF